MTDGPATLAAAVAATLPQEEPVAVVLDGAAAVVAVDPLGVRSGDGAAGLEALARVGAAGGWWAGWCGYDLGRAVERIPALATDPDPVPDVVLVQFGARCVLAPGRRPRLLGTAAGRRLLAQALTRARDRQAADRHTPALRSGPWTSSLTRDEWCDRVATIHEHLRAGDCYQVNLTRRLTHPAPLPPRALFAALSTQNPAPHAALVDARPLAGAAVVSASPERFLRRCGAAVETRPIKGTHRDAVTLAASAKDHAENVMIVDLARNDLGRICVPGSIEVTELCTLERHPGLHHLVSTIRGRLPRGAGLRDLLVATFPPASVTGAPKPRVLDIIERLEPVRRGVYCGAVGWIDGDRGVTDLNVAIRTFTVTEHATHLGVGAGIVADSEPTAEWEETELKSARLLAAAGGREADLLGALGVPAGFAS